MRISNRLLVAKCFAVVFLCVCLMASLALCVNAKAKTSQMYSAESHTRGDNPPFDAGFDMNEISPGDRFGRMPTYPMPPKPNDPTALPHFDGKTEDRSHNAYDDGRAVPYAPPNVPQVSPDASRNQSTDTAIVFGVVIAILSAITGVFSLCLLLSKKRRIK